jgi:hypothetical protein
VRPPDEEAQQEARLQLKLRRPLIALSVLNQNGNNRQVDPTTWLLPERVLPFLRAGASAVVGPWWPTNETADRIFWTTFYDLLARRLRLGEIVWRARLAVQQAYPHRPDGLAYALFGDPRARPYWPESSQGYTVLECLSPDDPLRPGQTYDFQVSVRARPPIWYQDRLIQTEELPDQIEALFMAPGLLTAAPKPVPLTPNGRTMRQATISLTPPTAGVYPLVVQLLEGNRHLETLQLILKVGEPSGEGANHE